MVSRRLISLWGEKAVPFLSYANKEEALTGTREAVLSASSAANWLRLAGGAHMASDYPANDYVLRPNGASDKGLFEVNRDAVTV